MRAPCADADEDLDKAELSGVVAERQDGQAPAEARVAPAPRLVAAPGPEAAGLAAPLPHSAAVLAAPLPPAVTRSDCVYTACYCEENVYLLAKVLQARSEPAAQLFIVFVSNNSKMVPLWRQRAAASEDSPVIWDYHVFLVAQSAEGQPALVFDLDSTLPFPCPLTEYSRHALLGGGDGLPPQYRRWYRVVPASAFLRHFASDRSHLRDERGGWQQPPPTYACIIAAEDGATNTLPAYLEFPPALAQLPQRQVAAGSGGGDRGGQPEGGSPQQRRFGFVLAEPSFLALFGGLP